MAFRSRLRPLARAYLRAPALALGVVATLAVGVGALTAAFAVVDAALLREPPFPDAGRVAVLRLARNPVGEPPREEGWSFPRWELLRAQQRSFERVANFTAPSLTLSGDADAELVRAEAVSASYFPLLRVAAARGRLFLDAEDDPAAPTPVALVSHALWTRRWAADPSLVGRPVRVNGVALTVVGVLPPGFRGLSDRADVWVPATMAPRLTYAGYVTTNQNFINVVGRLRDGVPSTRRAPSSRCSPRRSTARCRATRGSPTSGWARRPSRSTRRAPTAPCGARSSSSSARWRCSTCSRART